MPFSGISRTSGHGQQSASCLPAFEDMQFRATEDTFKPAGLQELPAPTCMRPGTRFQQGAEEHAGNMQIALCQSIVCQQKTSSAGQKTADQPVPVLPGQAMQPQASGLQTGGKGCTAMSAGVRAMALRQAVQKAMPAGMPCRHELFPRPAVHAHPRTSPLFPPDPARGGRTAPAPFVPSAMAI